MPIDMIYGTNDTHGFGLEVTIDQGEISPREIWENKDHYIGMATQSREEVWASLDEDHRHALVRIVQDSVERLHLNVNKWVPENIRAEGGEWIDVIWRITADDIKTEINRYDSEVEAQVADARADTASMLEGLV